MLTDAGIVEGLRRAGLIGAEEPRLVPLAGGVSCDVWKLETAQGPVVVKRPLAKLRVAAPSSGAALGFQMSRLMSLPSPP